MGVDMGEGGSGHYGKVSMRQFLSLCWPLLWWEAVGVWAMHLQNNPKAADYALPLTGGALVWVPCLSRRCDRYCLGNGARGDRRSPQQGWGCPQAGRRCMHDFNVVFFISMKQGINLTREKIEITMKSKRKHANKHERIKCLCESRS